eukprot:CAMPEP_0183355112 /NCGR_PEP_ID=MMETSP0164_2-20130417/39192_2 /TAXON_ID=221442 /ORGANISM="Coccolithus pelagicus ssp braarudi, Strain PLY182g" /LENGTH=190 /DNA_ID=CAMNT_0025528127 /DNA_START=162 /DNA_END=735 /DNA_ORIENTATION=-
MQHDSVEPAEQALASAKYAHACQNRHHRGYARVQRTGLPLSAQWLQSRHVRSRGRRASASPHRSHTPCNATDGSSQSPRDRGPSAQVQVSDGLAPEGHEPAGRSQCISSKPQATLSRAAPDWRQAAAHERVRVECKNGGRAPRKADDHTRVDDRTVRVGQPLDQPNDGGDAQADGPRYRFALLRRMEETH